MPHHVLKKGRRAMLGKSISDCLAENKRHAGIIVFHTKELLSPSSKKN
jgi:hypothetical protein